MKILLPPSEAKTSPASGERLDLASLSFPALAGARARVMDTLTEISAAEDALATLGVGASRAAEVEANTRLPAAPSAPAHAVYAGVLYAALGVEGAEGDPHTSGLGTIPGEHLEHVFVSSALFGMVNITDRIPAYRLSMGASLPPLGRLRTWWKKRLAPILDEAFADELVLDCRSADYRASWPGHPANAVTVDVVQLREGRRKVVSHFAKHTRGELAGRLLRRDARLPATAEELVEATGEWYDVEYSAPTARIPGSLTVVLPEG